MLHKNDALRFIAGEYAQADQNVARASKRLVYLENDRLACKHSKHETEKLAVKYLDSQIRIADATLQHCKDERQYWESVWDVIASMNIVRFYFLSIRDRWTIPPSVSTSANVQRLA